MFPLHRAWVQSLVRELRCRIPHGGAKKTRISGTRGAWQAAYFPFRVGISPPHWSQASGWAGAQKALPPAWDPSDHPIPFPDVQQIAERVGGGPRWRGGWYHFWGPGAVLQGILHKLRPRCFSGSEGALETTCPAPTFYTQGNRGRKWGVSSIPEPNKGCGGQAVTQ